MSRELRRKTPEEALRECQAEEQAAAQEEGASQDFPGLRIRRGEVVPDAR